MFHVVLIIPDRNLLANGGHLHLYNPTVHEGVKFACKQCDKQFTQLNSLTIHIQSLHEGVKYACNHCNYEGSRPALRLHMKSKHL